MIIERIRPNHAREVFLYGATDQKDYVLEHLPKYKGMTWRVICGSHDQTHLFNYGMDFGKTLAEERNDIIYLGQDKATINYGNCEVELFHPGGGCARILSSTTLALVEKHSKAKFMAVDNPGEESFYSPAIIIVGNKDISYNKIRSASFAGDCFDTEIEIRPVVYLSLNVEYESGNGTSSNPFVIK